MAPRCCSATVSRNAAVHSLILVGVLSVVSCGLESETSQPKSPPPENGTSEFRLSSGAGLPAMATIVQNCDIDDVNKAMSTLKWKTDGSSRGWLRLSDAPDLTAWYQQNPTIASFDQFNARSKREVIQNNAGTRPGFWLASGRNTVFFNAQLTDILKSNSADVIVLRPHGDSPKTLTYQFYSSSQTTQVTSVTKDIDYKNLYQHVRDRTVYEFTDSQNKKHTVPHVLLGYTFSTKAVGTNLPGDVEKPSDLVDRAFSSFAIDTGSLTSSQDSVLNHLEYLTDPQDPADRQPYRPKSLTNPAKYQDDVIAVNFSNATAAQKVADRALAAFTSMTDQSGVPILSGLATDGTHSSPLLKTETASAVNEWSSQTPSFICKYKAGLRGQRLFSANDFFSLFDNINCWCSHQSQ